MKALKSLASGISALASAGMILLCAGSASAQTFESVHGDITCMEIGRSVVVAKQGGYLAVGETFANSSNCDHSDIYIRRVGDDGRGLWGMWFDLGGDEYVTSVKEVFNDPTGRDGFIICGTTENQNNYCWTDEEREQAKASGWYDAFLLRVDYCGNVLWSHTYGKAGTTEMGWDVIETEQNNRGDLVLVGTTTFPNDGFWNPRNGYMTRVDGSNGNIIWDAFYQAPGQGDDNLYAVHESQNGDLIAAGSSDSYGSNYQGWLLRVDGNNGQMNSRAAAYGGSDFEEFRSVRELTAKSNNIVAVGTTHSLTRDDEVYLVETKPDPCDFRGDVVFGNFQTNAPSGGYGVREISFDGPYYRRGELIVTGYSWDVKKGRREDAFLQVVRPSDMARSGVPELNGPMAHYGGYGTDYGWSVEPVQGNGCRSDGFILVGFNMSPDLIGGDQAQLYLVKTEPHLSSLCTDLIYDVPWKNPQWRPECDQFDAPEIRADCPKIEVKYDCRPGGCLYCYCRLDTRPCSTTVCNDQCRKYEDEAEASGKYCQSSFFQFCKSKDVKNPKTLTGTEAQTGAEVTALNSVPNPVKRGNDLTLNYVLAGDATMAVTVTDITGREVHTSNVTGKAGEGALTIGTKGWAIGTYMVSVKVGVNVTTTRMVVME